MKTETIKVSTYEKPDFWMTEFSTESLVTTSPTGLDNEEYEEGSTEGWFNN